MGAEVEQKESELERDIGVFFLNHGIFCQRFPKVQSIGRRKMMGPLNLNGSPDLYIIHKGRFIGLEVKKPMGRLSPEQEIFHGHLRKAGANVYVCRSIEDASNVLKILKNYLD